MRSFLLSFQSKNDIKSVRYTFWQSIQPLVHATFSELAPPLAETENDIQEILNDMNNT